MSTIKAAMASWDGDWRMSSVIRAGDKPKILELNGRQRHPKQGDPLVVRCRRCTPRLWRRAATLGWERRRRASAFLSRRLRSRTRTFCIHLQIVQRILFPTGPHDLVRWKYLRRNMPFGQQRPTSGTLLQQMFTNSRDSVRLHSK